ncbi:MAG: hypothetical protein HZB51_29615 [Chloroflexi bacterium]|nr:hypothetical protein [Chloroflexota bacterium]
MSGKLTAMLRVNIVVTVLLGGSLFLFPGMLLAAIGWAPVDPLLTRVLGAALLVMAWGSVQSIRTNSKELTGVIIEIEALFYTLAAIGILRQLLLVPYPTLVWLVFAFLVACSVGWIACWFE